MYIIQCWIEHPIRSLDRTFTYLSDKEAPRGCRLRVPFGKYSLVGFSDSCRYTEQTQKEVEAECGMKLKFVQEVIDQEPILNEELYELGLWMKHVTISSTISCFQTMLPSKIKPSSNRVHVRKDRWVKVSEEEYSLTPKQLKAFLYVQEKGKVLYSELRAQFPSIARTLITKGALIEFEEEKEAEISSLDIQEPLFDLSDDQKHVIEEIESSSDSVFLLRGVTGSGKTEVYLRLASEALKKGKQVLFLVPEISLTPQMIGRVLQRFGNTLAIYHSGLNAQQKYEQYKLVKEGRARIVVGTRSSVFMPFESLGLIIMDEEHDASYKQDNQPCYHTRDVAIQRGAYHHCKVILGSATPSLESYARGIRHVYHLVELKHRINEMLPEVTILSIKDEIKKNGMVILSKELQKKIRERMDDHEQVILLLNRRGYHSQLRCRECGETLKCRHCDLALSYHAGKRRLVCHTCGNEQYIPKICPNCGSHSGFATYGYGTEKLEEEVHTLFPDARILRMDADTTGKKSAHEKILKAFGKHEADILLGTQMIAKGLDYPCVTLVGVLNGDEGLNREDFRSCEMTFDLLMQAGGRSGRADKQGEVVYQVFDPNHYALKCAAAQDYESFFAHEMQFRHAGMYPPYSYLIALTFTSRKQEEADRMAYDALQRIHGSFKVIGVISLLKIHDLSRNRILLKGRNTEEMIAAVNTYLLETKENTKGLRIDVNPMVLI